MPGEKRHLDYYDRKFIEHSLDSGRSYAFISEKIGVNGTTVMREIKRNRISREGKVNIKRRRNICRGHTLCSVKDLCGTGCGGSCKDCKRVDCTLKCPRFEPRQCKLLEKRPYVCNACPYVGSGTICDYERWFYDARAAQDKADDRMRETRRGFDLDAEQLVAMVETVKPLLKKGQSPEHIWSTHPGAFPVSARTFRSYVEEGVLDIMTIDLPKAVKYKKRRKKHVEPSLNPLYEGRTHDDFSELEEKERAKVVEMDCVESARGSKKTILTLMFRKLGFQIMVLLQEHTRAEVKRALDEIEKAIGLEAFREHLGLLKTDHGHEFNDFDALESSCLVDGEKRTRVYYCDPNRPDQKGSAERNHAILRTILPKKTCFEGLTKEDLALASSHVNSYARPSLGDTAPIDLAKDVLPIELFELLGIKKVSPEEITLKPSLLPHLV